MLRRPIESTVCYRTLPKTQFLFPSTALPESTPFQPADRPALGLGPLIAS